MDHGLYLSLLPIGMLFALLMFVFVFIADIWGKLFIAAIGLFTTICFFIIKSEPMHNFILYLDHSGITNSIYWTVLILIIPILTTLIRPLINILDNKSPLVQFLALFSFIVFILFILLIYMANIAYNIFGI